MAYLYTTHKSTADRWALALTHATGRKPAVSISVMLKRGQGQLYCVRDDQVDSALMEHILNTENHNKQECRICAYVR